MVFENLKKNDIVEADMAFYVCATVTTLVKVISFFPEHIFMNIFCKFSRIFSREKLKMTENYDENWHREMIERINRQYADFKVRLSF